MKIGEATPEFSWKRHLATLRGCVGSTATCVSEQTRSGPNAYSGGSRFAVRLIIGDPYMLETIAVILLILWVLGLFSAYTMGGLIHVLLVIAVVVLLVRVLQGRRVL